MSIVAWDGKFLAADKRGTFQGLSRTVTKIFRVEPVLTRVRVDAAFVGMCGNAAEGYDMIEWVRAGRIPDEFPVNQRDDKLWASCLVIERDGRVNLYERSPNPVCIEEKLIAIGSGRDFALAAMYLGKSAREAVEIACVFEQGCGNGVDVLELT